MTRRQTLPRQWLIVPSTADFETLAALQRLPRGTGVLLVNRPGKQARRRMRTIARARDLTILAEDVRSAARVHDMKELTRARLRRTPLILLSPLYRTASHPDWQPLARMRAATMARLARRSLIALGGMNAERYWRVEPLGFIGWAGISAFRT